MSSIVITGASGYIGSSLARRLAARGRSLKLVSRAWAMAGSDRRPDLQANCAQDVECVSADLSDERSWESLLPSSGAIIHLASHTDLRAAEAHPEDDAHFNIDPVRALVRVAERSGVRPLVIFASAVTIVGATHPNPVDEGTPDNPCSVYDRHKLSCETILREAAKSGILRACSLRLANVYGFGADSVNSNRGILNEMMKRALAGRPLTLYGDGAYVRDFIHVDDVAQAFVAAIDLDRGCNGEHYVIATGQGHTLSEAFRVVAEETYSLVGRTVEIRNVPHPLDLHPIERRSFIGDSRRFQSAASWQPTIAFRAGIQDYLARTEKLGARAANV